MNKFSNIYKINESAENTFLLGKKIGEIPESAKEVLDILETFKESNSEIIEICQIEKGYTTIPNIEKAHSATALRTVGRRKIGQMFTDGNIPDKWILIIKVLVTFKKFENDSKKDLPHWASDDLFEISTIDKMVKRYTALRSLSERCKYYGSSVKVTYNSHEKNSLIIFFD